MKNKAMDHWFALEPQGRVHVGVDVVFPNSEVRRKQTGMNENKKERNKEIRKKNE